MDLQLGSSSPCNASTSNATTDAKFPVYISKGNVWVSGASYLAQNFRITENDNTIFRSGQSNVQSARIIQKTDALMFIASNATKNNIILLTALECIDTSDFNLFVQVFLQWPIELHVVDDVGPLAFIRSDNTNLRGYDARFEEFSHNFFNIRSFSPIEM